jgi:hypothetical protein
MEYYGSRGTGGLRLMKRHNVTCENIMGGYGIEIRTYFGESTSF